MNKICYIGHHRFLPTNHPWRRKRADFDGTVENREKPEQFTHEELKQQLEKVKDVRPGKHPLPQGDKDRIVTYLKPYDLSQVTQKLNNDDILEIDSDNDSDT